MLRFATVQGRAHPRGAARWAVGVLGFRPTAIIQYGTNLVEGGRWHFEPSPPGRPLGRWAVGVQLAQTYATRPKCNSRMAMCVQSGRGLSVADIAAAAGPLPTPLSQMPSARAPPQACQLPTDGAPSSVLME